MGLNLAGDIYFHFEFFAPSPFRTGQRSLANEIKHVHSPEVIVVFRPQILFIIQGFVYSYLQYSFKILMPSPLDQKMGHVNFVLSVCLLSEKETSCVACTLGQWSPFKWHQYQWPCDLHNVLFAKKRFWLNCNAIVFMHCLYYEQTWGISHCY